MSLIVLDYFLDLFFILGLLWVVDCEHAHVEIRWVSLKGTNHAQLSEVLSTIFAATLVDDVAIHHEDESVEASEGL